MDSEHDTGIKNPHTAVDTGAGTGIDMTSENALPNMQLPLRRLQLSLLRLLQRSIPSSQLAERFQQNSLPMKKDTFGFQL